MTAAAITQTSSSNSNSNSNTNPILENSDETSDKIKAIVDKNFKDNESNAFVALPKEILKKIFSILDSKELGRLTLVCTDFFNICSEDSLWIPHVTRELRITLKEGESAFKTYNGIQGFKSNVVKDRYTKNEITFARNGDPTSFCVASTVYQNRVYAATNKDVVEIFDLDTKKKVGQDIPLGEEEVSELWVTPDGKLCAGHKENFDLERCLIPWNLAVCDLTAGETTFQVKEGFYIPDGRLYYNAFKMPGKFIAPSILTDWMKTAIRGKEATIADLFIANDTLYLLHLDDNLSIITANGEQQINVKVLANVLPNTGTIISFLPFRIIFANKDRVLIQYNMYERKTGYTATLKPNLHVIAWDPNDGSKFIQNNKPFSGLTGDFFKSFSIQDKLFLMYYGKFVVIDPQDFAVLGTFMSIYKNGAPNQPSQDFFLINFSHDGSHIFIPHDRQGTDFSIEDYHFTPKVEELLDEEQAINRGENQELRKKQKVYEDMVERLAIKDDDGCLDCCSGILIAFCICFTEIVSELLSYSWENLCDFIEWANSFIEKEQGDGIIGLNIPPTPVQAAAETDHPALPIPPDTNNGS